jgi:2-hydroxycyclohexanecarboxyl-CoA dehydrogenase
MRLAGKVAVVTGASRGIGRAIAKAYGAEGASVVVASRNADAVTAVAEDIEQFGGQAVGVGCDVGRRDQVFAMIQAAVDRYGTVDILVNNAQGFGTEASPAATPVLHGLEHFDEDEWEYTFRTGPTATMWAMKAAFPHMKETGGKIINFGSAAGMHGGIGSAAYNGAKEAIRALSRTAAREWGRYQIHVNVISPSLRTDAMDAFWAQVPEVERAVLADLPLRKFGEADDVRGLAVFLASSESDYITGMTVMIDSGKYMRP